MRTLVAQIQPHRLRRTAALKILVEMLHILKNSTRSSSWEPLLCYVFDQTAHGLFISTLSSSSELLLLTGSTLASGCA